MNDIIYLDDVLHYRLVQFRKRIVFDIIHQREDTIWKGEDDGDYFMFVASNGFQVISRSRMDIQTERLWLLGAKKDSHADRSGTMVFATQEMCDKAYPGFHKSLKEWADKVQTGDRFTTLSDFKPRPPAAYRVNTKDNLLIGHYEDKRMALDVATAWNGLITPLYE